MAKIPTGVLERQPVLEGLVLKNRGKVRDSYALPNHPDKMLVVVSDRISIFDFVLNELVEKKGQVLNAMSHFWTKKVLGGIYETDFVATGVEIDDFLPGNLMADIELQKRASVVKLFKQPDVEDIVRFVLTGSGIKSYNETGMICGNKLPTGLHDGSKLPFPIYTPTTKADVGHDEHITADSVVKKYGAKRERAALQVGFMMHEYASEKGIILADTKFEFSQKDTGEMVLVDEKGTPDSSRFVDKDAWLEAVKQKKFPASFDKQFVREWGKIKKVDKCDPKDKGDVEFVHSLVMPKEIKERTTEIYLEIFKRLTDMSLDEYQIKEMGIR